MAYYFGDRQWRDVDGQSLESAGLHVWNNAPWSMSLSCFFYFFPAFLVIMVCDVLRGPTLGDAVISRLQFILDDNQETCRSELQPEERRAAISALKFCRKTWASEEYEVSNLDKVIVRFEQVHDK